MSVERPTSSASDSSASDAAERASQVAGAAKDQAAEVAGTAKEQAGAVAQEVSRQTQNVVAQAKDSLHDQARSRTGEVAQVLHRWSDQARALTEGHLDDAGDVGSYATHASDKLRDLARRVDERGFDGLLEDIQRFARQKPGLFLVGAGVAGFVAGRLVRGATASDTDASGDAASPAAPMPVMGPAVWEPEMPPTPGAGAPITAAPSRPIGGGR